MAKKIDVNGLDHYHDKVSAMLASEYSSSKTYAVGDYCFHAGTLYECTTAITTAENWTAGHWTAAKLAEDTSALKTAVTQLEPEVETYIPSAVLSGETSGDFIEIHNAVYGSPLLVDANLPKNQSGSGDPTPSNIRPLTAYDSFSIAKSGKNLYDGKNLDSSSTTNLAFSSHKFVSGSNYRCIYQKVEGGHYYTVSRKVIEGNRFQLTTSEYEPAAGGSTGEYRYNTNNELSLTIYVPQNHNYIFVYLSQNGGTITASNYQIELGDKATEIEPYSGQEVELQIPNDAKPVYEGNIKYKHSNKWILTKSMIAVTFNGTETITSAGLKTNGTRFSINMTLPFKNLQRQEIGVQSKHTLIHSANQHLVTTQAGRTLSGGTQPQQHLTLFMAEVLLKQALMILKHFYRTILL